MKTLHLLIVITIISFCIVSVTPSYSMCIGTFQPNIQKDNGMDSEGYHTYLASINDNQTYPIKYKISSDAVIEAISSETSSPTLSIIVREVPQGGSLTIQLPTKLLGLYSTGGYHVAEGAMCAAIIGKSFPTPIESNLNFTTVEFPLMNYGGDEMIYITGNYQQPSTTSEFPSPLKQFKSGTPASDVKCNDGLQLVIKSEDGSPACVKPDTAYRLILKVWAKEFIQSVQATSSDLCEGTEIPSSNLLTGMVPVLVMKPNSTATVCVTYQFISDWNTYPNKDIYPHGIFETCCLVHMGKSSTVTSPNQFEVLADPPLFNVTGVHNESKITVVYKIHAGLNSSGFYDSSIPYGNCNSYPLAVGYNSSQVDASDFSYNMDIPCFNTIDKVDSVKIVSGMSYKEVTFR